MLSMSCSKYSYQLCYNGHSHTVPVQYTWYLEIRTYNICIFAGKLTGLLYHPDD